MKRKILSSLVGVAMLGAAASANAFIFDILSGDLNGAGLTVTGLPVLANSPDGSFSMALDLSTGFGNSAITTSLGGLVAGSSLAAHTLFVDGDIVLYNNLVTPSTLSRSYTDRKAFTGSLVTTLNSLTGFPSLPGTVDTTTAGFSGQMSIGYNGIFDNFPLLGLTGAGSGSMLINFSYNATTDVLGMSISETVLSGIGFEKAFDNIDNTFGVNSGTLAAAVWAGQSVTGTAPALTSNGNFNITVVPEPASLALLGIGIAGLGFMRRRKA